MRQQIWLEHTEKEPYQGDCRTEHLVSGKEYEDCEQDAEDGCSHTRPEQ
jgi:hypothetical protein